MTEYASDGPDRVVGERAFLWLLALIAVGVCATGASWVLDRGMPYGDDNSAHFAVAVHIGSLMESGQSNAWWHHSNLGVPLFAAYHPLPAVTMGAVLAALGGVVEPVVLFKASIVLCWALMPLSWAMGGRMIGLKAPAALVLGALTLAVHDPDSIGFGLRSSVFRGLYTQHVGLLLLPVAVGLVWRALESESTRILRPAVLFSALVMSHLWVGLYGAICIGAMVLAEPQFILRRSRRLVPIVAIALCVLSPWLVPLLMTNEYAGGLPWRRQLHEGWPWVDTVRRLIQGEVFDHGRAMWLTVLVFGGAATLLTRSMQPLVRRWVVLTVITGMLFLGRTNLGAAYDLLPLHSQVNVMRYITGVHICGLLAACAMGPLVIRVGHRLGGLRAARAGFALLLVGVLMAAYSGSRGILKSFDAEEASYAELVEALREGPDHRFAVHEALGTGSHFHRDLLPLLTDRGQLQSYAHGYHCTLSTYYAEYFDFSPRTAALFGVGAVVAKRPVPNDFPIDAWPEAWRNATYSVHRSADETAGSLVSFVAVRGALQGPSFRALRPMVKRFAVPAFARGFVPELLVDSNAASLGVIGGDGRTHQWVDTLSIHALQGEDAEHQAQLGEVFDVVRGPASYEARVRSVGGAAHVLLKVNAFPWWTAFVDNVEVPIRHVAPNFMAVAVPEGIHTVRWQFTNPVPQKVGVGVSIAFVLVALGGPRLGRRRRSEAPNGRA